MNTSCNYDLSEEYAMDVYAGNKLKVVSGGLFCGDFSGACADYQTAVELEKMWLLDHMRHGRYFEA